MDKPYFEAFSLINYKLNKNWESYNYWMVGNDSIKDLKGAKIELDATTFLIGDIEKSDRRTGLEFIDYNLNQIEDLCEYIAKYS